MPSLDFAALERLLEAVQCHPGLLVVYAPRPWPFGTLGRPGSRIRRLARPIMRLGLKEISW